MQVTYPQVFQFDTSSYEAADHARLAGERRAATAPAHTNVARRSFLGLALLRARPSPSGRPAERNAAATTRWIPRFMRV